MKKRLAIISVYAPAATNDEDAIATFYEILTAFLYTARDRQLELIVLDDLTHI